MSGFNRNAKVRFIFYLWNMKWNALMYPILKERISPLEVGLEFRACQEYQVYQFPVQGFWDRGFQEQVKPDWAFRAAV